MAFSPFGTFLLPLSSAETPQCLKVLAISSEPFGFRGCSNPRLSVLDAFGVIDALGWPKQRADHDKEEDQREVAAQQGRRGEGR